MYDPKQKSRLVKVGFSFAVRAGRLELPHLAALDPKSSVSTNSTTPALQSFTILRTFCKSECKYTQYV